MEPLEPLIRAAVAGDEAAWAEFVRQILPSLQRIIRSHKDMRQRGLGSRDDDLAEVATATLERLSRDGRRNLSRYLAQLSAPGGDAAPRFDTWLYGAADFAVREHLRKRYGRAPKRAVADPQQVLLNKRDLGSAAAALDEERAHASLVRDVGVTTNLTLLEIFAFVDETFPADGLRALRLHYVDDRSFDELAQELGLPDAAAAQKLIRRLNARLRHRFQQNT